MLMLRSEWRSDAEEGDMTVDHYLLVGYADRNLLKFWLVSDSFAVGTGSEKLLSTTGGRGNGKECGRMVEQQVRRGD